jgi:hypothetical protein
MAHRLVKQPNGNYSIFSTIVDAFVLYDASEVELSDYYLERYKEDLPRLINEKINFCHNDPKETFQEIKNVHGKDSEEYKEALEFFKE